MKQFSLVLNLLLLLAVGILYYLHFSQPKKKEPLPRTNVGASAGNKATQPLIAYVELDSLNEKITYIKNGRKALEAEQESIENEWRNSYRNLEIQRDNFLKKDNATIQQEGEQFQASLMQQQQTIDSRKQSLSQKLNDKSYKFMEDIQKKLKAFLEEYNQDKHFNYILSTGGGLEYMVFKDSSLNITQDVVEGMNAVMKGEGK
jgi:outer membrane protein